MQPDIVCLQETKVTDELFPTEAIKQIGYDHIAFAGEKSYNGVAILSKYQIDHVISCEFYNKDKRHLAVSIGDTEIHNFYVPAGGDIASAELNPKFKHKLEYVRLMENWLVTNRNKRDKLILVGDLNIAPHANDVWSSIRLKDVVSHTDIERQLLLSLQNSLDFTDSGRHFVDLEEKLYSWWSYRNKDWKKSDRGRRLDHIWVSTTLQNHLKNYTTLKIARDWNKPSDHVPVILEL
jgi:exodeoxyribonuclease-3